MSLAELKKTLFEVVSVKPTGTGSECCKGIHSFGPA